MGVELWAKRGIRHAKQAASNGVEGLFGIHWRTLETAWTARALAEAGWDVDSTNATALYHELATASFGESVAAEAAELLLAYDSFLPGTDETHFPDGTCSGSCQISLPRPGLQCCAKWTATDLFNDTYVMTELFGAVDQFMALRPRVRDAMDRLRFDEWAFQLVYQRQLIMVEWRAFQLTTAIRDAARHSTPAAQAAAARTEGVPALTAFSRTYEEMISALLQFTHTQGELGMIAQLERLNWDANVQPLVEELRKLLLADVPKPPVTFKGNFRDGNPRAMPFGPGTNGMSCSLITPNSIHAHALYDFALHDAAIIDLYSHPF
jgi:hypothetical protein